jgi:serine/threonine protein kinase
MATRMRADAGNLKEAIRQKSLMVNGQVKALEVALLALDIARACQAIHKHNIIHGDLKPHNVLLTSDPVDERGWLGKIADFGLSVKIKRGEQHVSGIQHGTEGYVAPEVLQTRRMVKASDVYSFGIIMWELWHARLYYEEYRHAQRRMCGLRLRLYPSEPCIVYGKCRGTGKCAGESTFN